MVIDFILNNPKHLECCILLNIYKFLFFGNASLLSFNFCGKFIAALNKPGYLLRRVKELRGRDQPLRCFYVFSEEFSRPSSLLSVLIV